MIPKLSIITICLNDKFGLEKTISSVVSQTFCELEFIVIDGASTDGSRELINKYSSKIAYSVSENDNGIYHAMNKGIRVAKGEYLLFLNAGDFLCNSGILKEIFELNATEDLLYCDMLYDCGSLGVQYSKQPEKLSLFHLYTKFLFHPSTFIKRDLFKKTGEYDEKFRIVADHDFFFNAVIIQGATSRYIPKAVSQHNNSGISSQPENFSQVMSERLKVFQKYLPQMVIDEMNNYVSVVNSRPFQYLKLLEKYPGLLSIGGKGINAFVKFRQLFRNKNKS